MAQAGRIADQAEADGDTLDYGLHLARLARTVAPTSQAPMLAEARLLLRQGDSGGGLKLLEDLARVSARLRRRRGRLVLGDATAGPDVPRRTRPAGPRRGLLLGLPPVAQERGGHSLQLGRACELTGEAARALKCFETVATFTGHPLYREALEAVRRLKAG